jgi:uncharacterized protein (TIGR00369 family)
LLPLLQRPFLQDLEELGEVRQRIGRDDLNVDWLVVDTLKVGQPSLDFLTLRMDVPETLVHEIAFGLGGDNKEPVGLGLHCGEVALELGDLLRWIGSLGQDLLCDDRDRRFDGIMETLHGGLLMTIADTTACWVVLTHWGPRTRLATTDMNIRFLAPCNSGVTCRARVIRAGRTLCPTAVDLFDADGRLVAVAQVTYIRLGDLPEKEPAGR